MGLRKMNRWTILCWHCQLLFRAQVRLKITSGHMSATWGCKWMFLHFCIMRFAVWFFRYFVSLVLTRLPRNKLWHIMYQYVILGSVAQVLLKMCLGMFWLLDLFWWKQNTWRHLPPDLFVFLACQGRRVQSLARSPAPLHPHELCFALFLHLPWSPGTKTGQVKGMWHCMTLTLQSGCSICRLKNSGTNSICA